MNKSWIPYLIAGTIGGLALGFIGWTTLPKKQNYTATFTLMNSHIDDLKAEVKELNNLVATTAKLDAKQIKDLDSCHRRADNLGHKIDTVASTQKGRHNAPMKLLPSIPRPDYGSE
jgi:hypothetical protein